MGGRRSLGAGCVVVLVCGYGYGLLRAQFYDTFSYFLFDAAVLGLYLAWFSRPKAFQPSAQTLGLYRWVGALVVWPILMFGLFMIYPQHVLIQLVGLRAAVWFLPFLLLGASLRPGDVRTITTALAILNLIALAFGLGEYILGLERFYPRNPITALIYRSNDVAGSAYRIPATFATSANYGAAMVASLPLLAGSWQSPGVSLGAKVLMIAGLFAAALGTFLCGSRTPVVFLFVLAVPIAFHLRVKLGYLVLIVLVGSAVAYFVSGEKRLQRFTSLQDPELVMERVSGSVSMGVLDVIAEYPLGVGLGSAFGTNIPTFLVHLAAEPIGAENEYARISIEQGLIGLGLWLGFLVWLVTRRAPTVSRGSLGGRLIYSFVFLSWLTACLGVGALAAIPSTIMLLLQMGILANAPHNIWHGNAARLRQHSPRRVSRMAGLALVERRTV